MILRSCLMLLRQVSEDDADAAVLCCYGRCQRMMPTPLFDVATAGVRV